MKIYYVSYLDVECGKIEAFTSKAKAQKRHNELARANKTHERCLKEDRYQDCDCEWTEHLFDLSDVDFPISKEGIREAFEAGSELVMK